MKVFLVKLNSLASKNIQKSLKLLKVSVIRKPIFQIQIVHLLLTQKSHEIIFLDAIRNNKRKEKQRLISYDIFMTKKSFIMNIKMINVTRLKRLQ